MRRLLSILFILALVAFAFRSKREATLKYVDEQWTAMKSGGSQGNRFKIPDMGGLASLLKWPASSKLHGSSRTWTFADGSEVNAVLVSADSNNVQLRVVQSQGLGQVKLDLLASDDRERIQSWVKSEGENGVAGFPVLLKTHRWPAQWRENKSVALERIGVTNQWRSKHFEITNDAGIAREALESIVLICESVDGALSALPLPFPANWGRPSDEHRKIIIEKPGAPGQIPNAAGYWDSRTGIVHIVAEYLLEPDLQTVVFEFDKPEKVQKYDVIVHEVTHQSTSALMYFQVPAWVPEGIAEYMSATQHAPAFYQFTSTHVSLRHHINKQVIADRIAKDRRMHLTRLDLFMERGIREWNETLVSGQDAGALQYHEALLLIDYFFHRDHPDGLHFRRYLESVLSGVDEREARQRHLMRGRSFDQIEEDIIKLWKPLGFTINYQDRGELRAGDVTVDWGAEEIKRTIATKRAMESDDR